MSNLMKHAEYEMRRAGLYDADADYGGMMPAAVLALVEAHSKQGHSGTSHYMALDLFNRVVNFGTLTPITSDPGEWLDRTEESGQPMWQSTRKPSVFSQDGGKTWYDLDKGERPK